MLAQIRDNWVVFILSRASNRTIQFMDEVEVWHQAPSRGASRLIEQSARSRERYFNSGAEVWWQGILEISRGCHAGGLPTHSAFLFGSSHTCHLFTLSLRGLPLGVDCRFCSPKEDALEMKKKHPGFLARLLFDCRAPCS